MTVHRALVPHSLDILRLQTLPDATPERLSSGICEKGTTVEPKLRQTLLEASDADHCLLTIDIKNTYGSPFEITLEHAEDGLDKATQRQRLEPGATAR